MTIPNSNYQKVREFHEKFRLYLDETVSGDLCDQRHRLIFEEVEEVGEELFWLAGNTEDNKAALAKELADLLYVTYGTAAALGIDIDKVFDKVHRNNMSKLGLDDKPVYREDGKLLKPEGYKPVDLETLLD